MDNIKNATATYSGGGIYIYTGQLENGDYFMTNDDFVEYVEFYNADPYEDFDESFNEIWQLEHRVGAYNGQEAYDFVKKIRTWIIIQNSPEGNYSVEEIESRLSRM